MATIQNRNDHFRLLFVYHGKRFTLPLGKVPQKVAAAKAAKVDEVLALLKSGYLNVPSDLDIVTFLQHDGKPPAAATPHRPKRLTLSEARDRYLQTHRNGTLEASTISGMELHFKHLLKTLGSGFALHDLGLADLQKHADRRAAMRFGGKLISSATIRKELVTLRTTWNWAVRMNLLTGTFPKLKWVRLPKPDEKPHFQTFDEIERQLRNGGMEPKQVRELWDSLYLNQAEIAELLEHVRASAHQPFIYPMVCFAAHTGARRSEILRAQRADVDFASNSVVIRERKRAHDRRTTRRVPLSPFLAQVLKDWLESHPGGPWLFCQQGDVARSKNKVSEPTPVSRDEAHDHFRRPLLGCKWSVVKGWHTLRHSFISCLASVGVDQRLIDEFVGHTTEQQRRRYRHLFPEVQQKAVLEAFR
jgi:integrase